MVNGKWSTIDIFRNYYIFVINNIRTEIFM